MWVNTLVVIAALELLAVLPVVVLFVADLLRYL
jgi:hypothetical protein